MLQAAFTSVLASHNPQLGAYMFPASRPFWLTSFYPCGWDPFHCLSEGGVYKCTPLDSLLGKSKYVGVNWEAGTCYDQDLYSAYCSTGGCAHHPLFCLSLSPARLLHSSVCPSLVKDYCVVEMLAIWYCHDWSSLTILLTTVHMTWLCILVFNLHALLLYMVTISFENPNSLIWWLLGP